MNRTIAAAAFLLTFSFFLFAGDEVEEARREALAYINAKSPKLENPVSLRLTSDYEPLDFRKMHFPAGAPLRFVAGGGVGPMVVSMRREKNGWSVDTRWWEALRELAHGREFQRGEPELVIREYLARMLSDDREGLSKLLPAGTDVDSLFPSDYHAPSEDQYYALIGEMPLVEVTPEEIILGPGGEFMKAARLPGNPMKIFIGQYGTVDLIFRLTKEEGAWRVLPASYLRKMEVW